MEIVRGGTVADLLRREGRLSPPRAVDLALQLVGGLRAYDAHGIVHRDIKPSNCFLDHDGRARIGDLGLSRSSETVSRLTREGRFLGTPPYSSPEQLRGEVVDRRSDIYSLGATLYEMIAGRPPIDAPRRRDPRGPDHVRGASAPGRPRPRRTAGARRRDPTGARQGPGAPLRNLRRARRGPRPV